MNDLVEELSPEIARRQLVDRLSARGWITRPQVVAAFAVVPRHLFAPSGTTVEAAYADDTVVTKRGPDGKTTSSISAPWLQAYMIETARIRPGSRVLEVGSGGYNAALIAEVVGAAGTVVSVDIDAQVVAHARAALDRAGYRQVRTVQADGEDGYRAGGPYDAVLVTVEAAVLWGSCSILGRGLPHSRSSSGLSVESSERNRCAASAVDHVDCSWHRSRSVNLPRCDSSQDRSSFVDTCAGRGARGRSRCE